MSFENLFDYSATQFDIILSVFTLTAAVFAAVLVYSIVTAGSIAPRLPHHVVPHRRRDGFGLSSSGSSPCGGPGPSRGTVIATSKTEISSRTASAT